jgi:2-haloalkanoic acid dehalogenase type II
VRYDVVTFDCYGTLIDWNAGIWKAFVDAAAADNVRVDPQALRELYAEIEPAVEAEPYRAYREVLAETARRAAARADWMMADPTAEAFAASLPEWRPFADTNAALERLSAAGIRLGILSNVDRDLLAGTLRHFRVEFEIVVTAEDVGSYKPAHGHFLEGRRRVGDARWLHAAQSYFHDVVPCDELGIDSAWINRHGDTATGTARPTRELSTLADHAEWIGRR